MTELFAPGDRVFVFVLPASKTHAVAGFGVVGRTSVVHCSYGDATDWGDTVELFEVRLDDGNLIEVSAADLYDTEEE